MASRNEYSPVSIWTISRPKFIRRLTSARWRMLVEIYRVRKQWGKPNLGSNQLMPLRKRPVFTTQSLLESGKQHTTPRISLLACLGMDGGAHYMNATRAEMEDIARVLYT